MSLVCGWVYAGEREHLACRLLDHLRLCGRRADVVENLDAFGHGLVSVRTGVSCHGYPVLERVDRRGNGICRERRQGNHLTAPIGRSTTRLSLTRIAERIATVLDLTHENVDVRRAASVSARVPGDDGALRTPER